MASTDLGQFLQRLTRGMVAKTLGDQSDPQLVERALAGQAEAAFEALVRRHGPMVYRVCWRVLQQEQDSEDVFQATFLLLAQKLFTVRKHASLASWLHGVAHRVALKARARAATRRRHETQPPPAGPPDDATWVELRAALDAELADLPEKWRLPLLLCYLEGRTQEEAAEHLGWSKNTLRRRLEEARLALGRRLARRGVWPAALSAALLSDSVAPAALPPQLIMTTVEAVAGFVSSTTAVSAEITALMEGGVTSMSLGKTKIALTLVLAVGSIITAAGLAAPSAPLDAPARPGAAATPDPGTATKPATTAEALAGRWLLTLPAGFKYQVVVRSLGGQRLAIDNAVRFSGVYELRADRLVLVKPNIRTEQGFEWAIRGEEIALAAQPPVGKTGQNYLGAKLTRRQ